MSNKIKLYNNDCVEQLKQLESECIDLTITSPPYDNLRIEIRTAQVLSVMINGAIK